ncbi:MAG: hypothetical protein QOJ78_2058, partial [Pseudonocardiales bacterium]|nr:hypothetical protein [Pseudonocardiales bacterium]
RRVSLVVLTSGVGLAVVAVAVVVLIRRSDQ